MKPIKTSYFCKATAWAVILVLSAFISGCSMGKPKKPVRHIEPAPKQETPAAKETPEPEAKPSLTKVLLEQARKFTEQGEYQDALLVYNQALFQVDLYPEEDVTKDQILSTLENTLSLSDPELIREFLQIKQIAIPESLLLYYLGANLASQGDVTGSKAALIRFVGLYPDDAHAGSALEMIDKFNLDKAKPNTIGCLLPLTGKYEVYGQKVLKGVELAVQDLHDEYGFDFNMIVKDTQSDDFKAGQAVDLLAQKNVIGIVGPLLTLESAGKRAQELGIPMIALTQKTDFPSRGDYLFSNFITPEMQVHALLGYARNQLNVQRAAILYPDERYGQKYMEIFLDTAQEFYIDVVGVESYPVSATDFSAPIKKLTGGYYQVPTFLKENLRERTGYHETNQWGEFTLSPATDSHTPGNENQPAVLDIKDSGRGFQAVFIPESASKLNQILPQFAYNDVKGMVLLGTNLWHNKTLLEGSSGYHKNAVITDGFFSNSTRQVTRKFKQNFTDVFGSRPGFFEAVSYDTVRMVFETCMNQGVTSRQELKEALKAMRVYEGVTGDTGFDENGAPRKDLFLITIKRGRFVEIEH